MAQRRRFSIDEKQADTVVKALKMALHQMYTIKDESPYASWLIAEMETLEFKLETYKFYKEG